MSPTTFAEKRQIPVTSPIDGSTLENIDIATLEEINQATKTAQTASQTWAAQPARDRVRLLINYKQKVEEQIYDLASIISLENGKTQSEARDEINRGLEVIEFAASIPNQGLDHAMEVSRGVQCRSERVPLGVTLGITPFNFPVMVPMWMFPISIACGNSFILKPSEQTPLAAKKMAEIFNEVGLPEGVFNVVNGDRETARLLIEHETVKAIGFVGSTPAARSIYALAGEHGKRALALGGAKNHITLMPDADPDIAAANIVASAMGCAGQRCMAASVLITVGNCDEVMKRIIQIAQDMVPGKDLGAVISQTAKERIIGYIDGAETEGAKILVDGRTNPSNQLANGSFVGPTIIDGVSAHSACVNEEIFGPVLSVLHTNTLNEALAIENASSFGNAAAIYTSSGAAAEYYSARANAGMVGVNIGVPVPRDPFPFGGWNTSRFGAGDITGEDGIRFWTQSKKITSKWTSSAARSWMS